MLVKNTSPLADAEHSFVHRDLWKSLCDYHIGIGDGCDPTTIDPGSSVFIYLDDGLAEWRKILHQLPSHVVVAYGCYPSPDEIGNPKVKKCLAHHKAEMLNESKYIGIPYGAYYIDYPFQNRVSINQWLISIRQRKHKTCLLNSNFGVSPLNVGWRKPLLEKFVREPYCTTVSYEIPYEGTPGQAWLDYMERLSTAQFCLSPPGDQTDCCRHWESLLVGTIPIIQHEESQSRLDRYFDGLPVLIVRSYDEVNEQFLHGKYKEFSGIKWNLERLYAPYWVNLLNNL
jgi:hypothetical protein